MIDRAGSTPAWVRWRALVGVAPLGIWLVFHLVVQASAMGGMQRYMALVSWIEALPASGALELGLVIGPLLFHALTGAYLIFSRRSRPGDGWAQALSGSVEGRRALHLSGLVVAPFVAYHVWQLPRRRWLGELDSSDFYDLLCASLSATVWGGVPLCAMLYVVGVGAACFHLSYGLYHVIRPRARVAPAARLCVALGICTFLLGCVLIVHLATGSALAAVARFGARPLALR